MWLVTHRYAQGGIPTPTPVAIPIDVGEEGDEAITREDFIEWLRKYYGLQTMPDVWRGEQPYLAVVWPWTCPTPQPMPTFSDPGPTGPGW